MLLTVFGDLENLFSDHIYPNRFLIAPLLVAVVAGVLLLAYRAGLHRPLWRNRSRTAVIGTPLLAVALAFGYYALSPLFERSHLDEASPLAMAAMMDAPTGADAVTSTVGTSIARRGMFEGADDFHFGRGDALVIKTEGGHVLRFENFSVRNGPDLYVYLSRDATGHRVEESLNLGRLKATDGAVNYEVPSGMDLDGVKSVVVWCRQFRVQFAVAALM